MTIRAFGALLCGAAFLLATQTNLAQAQSASRSGVWDASSDAEKKNLPGTAAAKKKKKAGIVINLPWAKGDRIKKKSTQDSKRATTVKSSKSNTSDRMGGGGGKGSAARATTVKSSKSNTSDRMGGGGGRKTKQP